MMKRISLAAAFATFAVCAFAANEVPGGADGEAEEYTPPQSNVHYLDPDTLTEKSEPVTYSNGKWLASDGLEVNPNDAYWSQGDPAMGTALEALLLAGQNAATLSQAMITINANFGTHEAWLGNLDRQYNWLSGEFDGVKSDVREVEHEVKYEFGPRIDALENLHANRPSGSTTASGSVNGDALVFSLPLVEAQNGVVTAIGQTTLSIDISGVKCHCEGSEGAEEWSAKIEQALAAADEALGVASNNNYTAGEGIMIDDGVISCTYHGSIVIEDEDGNVTTNDIADAIADLVPYSGAKTGVDLGDHDLSASQVSAGESLSGPGFYAQMLGGGSVGINTEAFEVSASTFFNGTVNFGSFENVSDDYDTLPGFVTNLCKEIFVPYSGATGDVDLGDNSLTANHATFGGIVDANATMIEESETIHGDLFVDFAKIHNTGGESQEDTLDARLAEIYGRLEALEAAGGGASLGGVEGNRVNIYTNGTLAGTITFTPAH